MGDGKDADLKEPFNKLEQLISEESISDTLEAEFQDSDFAEPSFLLSAPIVSHPDAKDGQDAVPNFSNPNQPDPFSPSSSAFTSRTLKSEPIKDVKNFKDGKDGKDARILSENVKETLARNELIYQSQLLEKDKELHAKEMEIQKIDQQVSALKRELKSINDGHGDMMKVLQEYEKTISEMYSERERERVCMEIEKEKLARERDQTLEDLMSAERAFSDVHRKYERTKEIITGFKKNEDDLKHTVSDLANKVQKGEERFEILKSHAEEKLNDAYEEIESFQKSRDSEVAQLQAMLRKAEMRVNNLERTVEQKSQENAELTAICDELIAKVGN